MNFLLAITLVASALALVTSQDRARRLKNDLARNEKRATQIELQWDQLKLEQAQLTKPSLIDAKARRELAMRAAAPERTIYLSLRAEEWAAAGRREVRTVWAPEAGSTTPSAALPALSVGLEPAPAATPAPAPNRTKGAPR